MKSQRANNEKDKFIKKVLNGPEEVWLKNKPNKEDEFGDEIADENEAWASIADHRYGAVADGDFLLTEELIGQEIDFVKGGQAIKLEPGFWNVIVDLNKKKVTFFQREGNPLDVNHDGYVNVGDVNVILNAILEEVYDPALDVNADGYVNVGDVNVILAYINEHA